MLNTKAKKWYSLGLFLAFVTTVVIFIMSVSRTYGTYLFDQGSSDWLDAEGNLIDGFATRAPILGDLIWGSASFVKISLFLVIVASLASLGQLISNWNGGEKRMLTSSIIMFVMSVLSWTMSANAGILAMGIILTLLSIVPLLNAIKTN